MKHMEIFEQAMCCPTGLCGPSIDPELLRVSTVLDTLKQHGIDVGRYNLTSAPLKFVQTKAVTEFLQHHGPEDLPLILIDGAVQFAGQEEVFRLDDVKGIVEDHLQSPPQQHDGLSGSAGVSPQQQLSPAA